MSVLIGLGGGPQSLHTYPVGNQQIPCSNPYPGCYARAQNVNFQFVSPDPGATLQQQRLQALDIQIIEGMTNSAALTNTFAHELGHTFALDDCTRCGNGTVMDIGEPAPAGSSSSATWNFVEGTSGPTQCDLSVIAANVTDYQAGRCTNMASENQPPPTCNDGSAVGFVQVGESGEYTCGGQVCDGCNGACSNFAPAKGCSGNPAPSCANYCGDTCMDGVTCPGGDLGSLFAPACTTSGPDGIFYCPSDTNNSPIIVDAFHEGFHMTSLADGVEFSLQPGRPPRKVSWTNPSFRNGWLVLDRNGNGKIDDLSELFGNLTPQPASEPQNGYKALAVFNRPDQGGNANGLIDPGDSVYGKLAVWIDANHNGKVMLESCIPFLS